MAISKPSTCMMYSHKNIILNYIIKSRPRRRQHYMIIIFYFILVLISQIFFITFLHWLVAHMLTSQYSEVCTYLVEHTCHILGMAICIFNLNSVRICINLYQITCIQICRTYHNNTWIQHIKQINTQYNLIEILFIHEKKAEEVMRILQTRKKN